MYEKNGVKVMTPQEAMKMNEKDENEKKVKQAEQIAAFKKEFDALQIKHGVYIRPMLSTAKSFAEGIFPIMRLIPLSPEEVKNIIYSDKKTTAPGPDTGTISPAPKKAKVSSKKTVDENK